MLAFAKKGPPASESTSKTGEVLTSIPPLFRDYGKKKKKLCSVAPKCFHSFGFSRFCCKLSLFFFLTSFCFFTQSFFWKQMFKSCGGFWGISLGCSISHSERDQKSMSKLSPRAARCVSSRPRVKFKPSDCIVRPRDRERNGFEVRS